MKLLLIKASLGLASLITIIGAMLFISAGTTHYRKGWGYLAVFIFVISGLDRRFGWSQVPLIIAVAANAITTGPYAIARHPMYSGALLLLLSTPIALGSWWALLSFIPICGVIVARLLYEEQFLKIHLNGYKDYCSHVRSRLCRACFDKNKRPPLPTTRTAAVSLPNG